MMTRLPYTESNINLVQDFLDQTNKRILDGESIIFTYKAQSELADLSLTFDIGTDDVEDAILNLSVEDYYLGIDPSGNADFNVCASYTEIGRDKVGIYLKYGLEARGLQILVFSNHPPKYPMAQPFKK